MNHFKCKNQNIPSSIVISLSVYIVMGSCHNATSRQTYTNIRYHRTTQISTHYEKKINYSMIKAQLCAHFKPLFIFCLIFLRFALTSSSWVSLAILNSFLFFSGSNVPRISTTVNSLGFLPRLMQAQVPLAWLSCSFQGSSFGSQPSCRR